MIYSKVDKDILSKIIGNLNMLLYDENVNIKKKVMLSMGSLYRTAIKVTVSLSRCAAAECFSKYQTNAVIFISYCVVKI